MIGIILFKKKKKKYLKIKEGYPILGKQKEYILKHIEYELACCYHTMRFNMSMVKYIDKLVSYREKIYYDIILSIDEIAVVEKFISNISYPIMPNCIKIT